MMFDPGLFAAWCALWLACAILVRRAGARVLAHVGVPAAVFDWTFLYGVRRAYRKFKKRGWRHGRHGLPDALATAVQAGRMSIFELEQTRERPPTRTVGIKAKAAEPTEAEAAEAAKMTALADEVRAEQAEKERRAALVAALQENTTQLPLVVIEQADAAARTRAEFAAGDDMAAQHDLEFAAKLGVFLNDNAQLLAELGIARMYRGWVPSATGEQPVVRPARIPRQREAAAAAS